MFKKLRARWHVSGLDLLLILTTFALGGSACAQLSKLALNLLSNGDKDFFWWAAYLALITLLWPVCVLIISIPLFQYRFFSNYLKRVGARIFTKKYKSNIYAHKIAIFASGKGSNAANIISYFSKIKNVKIGAIVTNNPDSGVVEMAKKYKIKLLIIGNQELIDANNLLVQLQKEGITFIALAGFLKKMPRLLVDAFPEAMVNIHPALLPKFGGKGMYGMRVHEAVLQAGESKSGITIHFVDDQYDHGSVIRRAVCDIDEGETPDSLSQKIHLLEKYHYPRVIHELLLNAKS